MKTKIMWETEIDLTDTNISVDELIFQINEFLTTNVPINLFWNYKEEFGTVVRRTDVPFKVISIKACSHSGQRQIEVTDNVVGC